MSRVATSSPTDTTKLVSSDRPADDIKVLLDDEHDAVVSNVVEFDPKESTTLVFTDRAANKVKSLIDEEQDDSLKLRVFISGGGCSGFQYGFTFDEQQNDDDFVVEKNGVQLLVDAMSMQYLEGAEIDYKEDETGEQFVIKNPNAKTTCGCGSSFSA